MSVDVKNNPAPFVDDIELEVQYECLTALKDDLEWKVGGRASPGGVGGARMGGRLASRNAAAPPPLHGSAAALRSAMEAHQPRLIERTATG